MDATRIIGQRLNFDIGDISFSPSYIQAGAIVVLLFLLVLSFALFRKYFVSWSLKGALFGVFFGFLFALILEGFLIIGGKTALTELVGWKNAPRPIVNILDAGRNKLVQVLGVADEIPSSAAKENTKFEDIVDLFRSLNPQEAQRAKKIICQP